jgi:2-polyprenyl-3-methyl-5-hydroxy-6-metoxy-1,4-benzoquinol methylase
MPRPRESTRTGIQNHKRFSRLKKIPDGLLVQGVLGYYASERVTPTEWERSYGEGAWKRLETMVEVSHYSTIVGYCDVLNKKRILDIGCGHGVLAGRLKHLPYVKYCGLDISQAAISEATVTQSDQRNEFTINRADAFETDERFDMIVFNEIIYYLDDPVAVVSKYQSFLNDTGHILISMYKSSRSKAAWTLLESILQTIDETTIKHMSGACWVIKIATPMPHQSSGVKKGN